METPRTPSRQRRSVGPYLALLALSPALSLGCTGVIEPDGEQGGPNAAGNFGGFGSGAGAASGSGALQGTGLASGLPPGTGSKPGSGPPVGAPPTVEQACTGLNVGVTPLRRLSRAEYNNTVRDLLGDTTHPADNFAPDEKLLGFAAGLDVSSVLVEQYRDTSEKLARVAVADVPKLLGCAPETAGTNPCAEGFIDSFGRRAYRRPLDAEERAGLLSLYQTSRDAYGTNTGVELVLQAILQSPQFLYRVETGAPSAADGVVQLGAYEVASRLSYFLWQTAPDDTLLAAATAGSLDTPDGIETSARDMVQDARSHQTVRSFHSQWLQLDELESVGKDESVYPGFDDALRASMQEETLRFVESVIFDSDAKVDTLLKGSFSFVDGPLAALYGIAAPSASGFTRVDLDPTQRAGILTQPAVLSLFAKANQSSPVHRGKFVRERILCHQLRPPPAGFIIVPPNPDPSLPTRARFEEHTKNPACAQCHQLTNPIGFGFEHYDGIGRYREKDGDFDIDASGEIVSTRDADGKFDGIIELSNKLAASEQVRECIASNWFVYAFGRSMQNSLDACSRATVYESFSKSGYDIRELLVALVKTDAFRFRRETVEGAP